MLQVLVLLLLVLLKLLELLELLLLEVHLLLLVEKPRVAWLLLSGRESVARRLRRREDGPGAQRDRRCL